LLEDDSDKGASRTAGFEERPFGPRGALRSRTGLKALRVKERKDD